MSVAAADVEPSVPALDRRTLAAALLAGLVTLVALRLWQRDASWDGSEGVYLLTSQLWLDGKQLYGEMAAAQPPGLFVLGAGILDVHGTLGFARWVLGAAQVGGGLLAGVVVLRLSGSRVAAVLACPLALLVPWAVHEHGALVPEVPAVPLLLAAALLASRRRTAPLAGVLAALALSLKLPFALPALGVVACAADRRGAALAAGATLAAGVALSLAVFGGDLWRDVVGAQGENGFVGPGYFVRLQALQAVWNLAGLLLGAVAAATVARGRLHDAALARACTGLCVGMGLTALTTVHDGTGVNVLMPVEAVLLPAAVVGVVALADRPRVRAVAVAGVVFTLVQTAELLVSPAHVGFPFIYPGSPPAGWSRQVASDEVAAARRAAAGCGEGLSYSGLPILAFAAHRPPIGGQPDNYLPFHGGKAMAAERAAVVADTTRCP